MKKLPFTRLASRVLDEAKKYAKKCGSYDIGSIDLFFGLTKVKGTVAYEVIQMHGVTEELLKKEVKRNSVIEEKRVVKYTPRAESILALSGRIAVRFGNDSIGTEHLLLAVLKDEENEVVRFLKNKGIAVDGMYIDTLVTMGLDEKDANSEFVNVSAADYFSEGRENSIEDFSTDLTKLAFEDELDPMVGRETEMNQVLQVLCRRTKNNPCLIGEPGVGKTAIIEGLAKKIVLGQVPDTLKGKRLLSLDLTRVVAGTKYRGEFEERMKKIITEVEDDDSIILFIDEIHTMIGTGGSEGAMDASNILKPSLARGNFQLIGATTSEEYTKYFEKDAALARRFQPIRVEQTTVEQTIEIIKGIKYKFEAHHRVLVDDSMAETIVKLSDRYIGDRFLPDKAIDLLDESCARKRMEQGKGIASLEEIQKSIKLLNHQMEEAISNEDMSLATRIKEEKQDQQDQLLKLQKKNQRKNNKLPVLEESDIEEVIAAWTKIPMTQLQQKEMQRLRRLDDTLHKEVIGQDKAVTAVAKAIKRSRVGLNDPKKPIGSFLFLGPTGVGKTQLSKILAKTMFGREEDLIRVDMSEYMEKHSVSKIIGSPPGYVGFGEGGQLSEQVRNHPYSVILFDEIEKAHPDVFNILLQVLDDGHITDTNGRKVDFKNTIIIMTSNAGANRIISPKKLGFTTSADKNGNHEAMTRGVMEEVHQIFRPEFLNRIDETIVFTVLTKDEIKKIAKLQMKGLISQLKDTYNITLKVTSAAYDVMTEKGFDEKYGARPLKRVIQREIEDVLADKILEGELKADQTVVVGKNNKNLTFSFQDASKKK
ncbi:MAG: ATP-dependent Clp protease ATP-binding subunit [Anaerostipes sp.]|jgi:ATP-dependent Clp protease ATP-binding subunit ClpC